MEVGNFDPHAQRMGVTKIPIVYVSLYVDIYFACRYYFHSQKIPTIYVFCM